MLNHPSLKAIKSNFTRVRYAQINWQVLEDTRLLFDQRIGPNNFTNNGPKKPPTAYLGGLIEDVRRKNLLDSVTMPGKFNTKDHGKNWSTHHDKGKGERGKGKGQGAISQSNGSFYGAVPMTRGTEYYSQVSGNLTGEQSPQGRGWKDTSPEHLHPVLSSLWQGS